MHKHRHSSIAEQCLLHPVGFMICGIRFCSVNTLKYKYKEAVLEPLIASSQLSGRVKNISRNNSDPWWSKLCTYFSEMLFFSYLE